MIYSYGVTQQGQYHIDKEIVCQDAHYIKKINDRFAISAVADGLGSEKYSDIASKIAVEESVKYCAEKINETDSDDTILSVIKESFQIALDKINETAKKSEHDNDQYDTTLALAVYIKGNLYYGNSGDSGIIALKEDGYYFSVTTQQRDENGCVFPLCFGETEWKFGTVKNVASVLLATDGIYETLFPYLLHNEEETMYIALARYLMSEESLNFSNSEEKVQENMESFIASIPGEQVSDDKTVLVMLDDSIVPQKLSDEYYAAPDWDSLKKKRDEEYRREAYPHLYSE